MEENGTVFARDPGSSHDHADYLFSVHEVYTKLIRSTGGKFTLEELKPGDRIEILYTGDRAACYPADLGSVGMIRLLEGG